MYVRIFKILLYFFPVWFQGDLQCEGRRVCLPRQGRRRWSLCQVKRRQNEPQREIVSWREASFISLLTICKKKLWKDTLQTPYICWYDHICSHNLNEYSDYNKRLSCDVLSEAEAHLFTVVFSSFQDAQAENAGQSFWAERRLKLHLNTHRPTKHIIHLYMHSQRSGHTDSTLQHWESLCKYLDVYWILWVFFWFSSCMPHDFRSQCNKHNLIRSAGNQSAHELSLVSLQFLLLENVTGFFVMMCSHLTNLHFQ